MTSGASSTPLAPSGQQYELACGDYRAVIVEVGGGIRSLQRGQRDVLQPYPVDAMCDAAHGAPLIPWPNRLADGRYSFDGIEHQLALTEPEKHNAIHGLLRWRQWQPLERSADRVVMSTRLYPMQGYPFALEVTVDYSLSEQGLAVRTTATNIGQSACPYGAGQHPYLAPGPARIDDCLLQFDAEARILTSAERQLPVGTEPVPGTAYDFAHPRRLGELKIDNAFTGLARDQAGRSWVRLRRPDGLTAQLWVDEAYPILEIFTADTLNAERRRGGLGVEPMTCPPDAFSTGQHVRRLEPGESTSAHWGAQLVYT